MVCSRICAAPCHTPTPGGGSHNCLRFSRLLGFRHAYNCLSSREGVGLHSFWLQTFRDPVRVDGEVARVMGRLEERAVRFVRRVAIRKQLLGHFYQVARITIHSEMKNG